MFIIYVIGARDAKRSDMAGGSHANGVVNVRAGFSAKRKGPVHEVNTFPL